MAEFVEKILTQTSAHGGPGHKMPPSSSLHIAVELSWMGQHFVVCLKWFSWKKMRRNPSNEEKCRQRSICRNGTWRQPFCPYVHNENWQVPLTYFLAKTHTFSHLSHSLSLSLFVRRTYKLWFYFLWSWLSSWQHAVHAGFSVCVALSYQFSCGPVNVGWEWKSDLQSIYLGFFFFFFWNIIFLCFLREEKARVEISWTCGTEQMTPKRQWRFIFHFWFSLCVMQSHSHVARTPQLVSWQHFKQNRSSPFSFGSFPGKFS